MYTCEIWVPGCVVPMETAWGCCIIANTDCLGLCTSLMVMLSASQLWTIGFVSSTDWVLERLLLQGERSSMLTCIFSVSASMYACTYIYTLLHMAVYVYCMCVSLCTYIHRQCFNGVMNIRTYMLNDHVRGLGRRVFNGTMETHSATCLWASYIREANPIWTSI